MPENNAGRELVEARISNLEQTFAARLSMLEQKVDNATRATEKGFDYMGTLLDQRFTQADQKSEHASREMRQSIEFLTEQLKATMMEQSATATKVGFLETDVKRLKDRIQALEVDVKEIDKTKAAAKDLADLESSIQWHYRALAGGLIATVTAGVGAVLKLVN